MLINRNYAFWMILERLMRLLGGFFIYLIFAKYISVSDFGVLNLVLAIISILSSFIFFGADQYNLYKIKTSKNKFGLLGDIIFLRFIMFLFSFFLLFVLSLIYKEINSFYYIILMILITNIFLVFAQFIQANGGFVFFAKVSTFSLLFGFLLKIYFIILNKKIYYFFWAAFFENLILVLFMGFYVYKYFKKNKFNKFIWFDIKGVVSYFNICFPLMLSSLMVIIYFKLEIMLVKIFLGNINAGYWGVLLLTLAPWMMLCSAISPILNHQLSKFAVDSFEYRKCLNKFFKYYICLSIFGILLNLIIIKLLLVVFLGPSYLGAVKISLIASLVILPIFLGSLQDVSIAHRGKTKIVLNKLIFGLPFSIILFTFSIYHYNLIGGAISLMISYYITSIFSNFFFDRYFFNQTFAAIYGRDRWKRI